MKEERKEKPNKDQEKDEIKEKTTNTENKPKKDENNDSNDKVENDQKDNSQIEHEKKKNEKMDNEKKENEKMDNEKIENDKNEQIQNIETSIKINLNQENEVKENNLKNKPELNNETNNNNDNKLEISNKEYIPDIIGKLYFSPLLLLTYQRNNNSIHMEKLTNIPKGFESLNSTSSYCNGNNHLIISGGLDNESNDEIIDKFCIINLTNFEIDQPLEIQPKNNHNMIYIPERYIFIVGGNDVSTFYYDFTEKKIYSWGDLNKVRIDPALIQVNNYLYVFDNNFDISIERTNLLSNGENWELIIPDISGNTLIDSCPCQKYFGVCKDTDDNIIFLGGYISYNSENINQVKNQKYNIEKNLIEFSDVNYTNILLKEKKFLSFNDKNDIFFMLTDCSKKCPKIAFYLKSKKEIRIIDYIAKDKNINTKREIKNNDSDKDITLKGTNTTFKNLNFNMPIH